MRKLKHKLRWSDPEPRLVTTVYNASQACYCVEKIESITGRNEKSIVKVPVKVKVVQSCPTLCDPMYYTVHRILQARILEWVAFPFSRGSRLFATPCTIQSMEFSRPEYLNG